MSRKITSAVLQPSSSQVLTLAERCAIKVFNAQVVLNLYNHSFICPYKNYSFYSFTHTNTSLTHREIRDHSAHTETLGAQKLFIAAL